MFANYLTWDDFDHGEFKEPMENESQIQDRILALNGESRTLVVVSNEEALLAVGGSAAEGLVVYATFGDGVFHQLSIDIEDGDREVVVVAGGQPGNYPARHVVPVGLALRAAQTFAIDGRLDDIPTWRSE